MESKFKVGDKVISTVKGIGEVISIDSGEEHPIRVYFGSQKGYFTYKENGVYRKYDTIPEIYLEGEIHPLLNVPVKVPKQKVKKEIILYANIYPKGSKYTCDLRVDEYGIIIYNDANMAKNNANNEAISKGAPLTISFEVEE